MTNPSVYVGTYAKYNDGSIAGKWLDLTNYADHDEFIAACKALHSDETDPELMFQDFEGFPAEYYDETEINSDLWDDYLNLDDDDKALLAAYINATGASATEATIESARDQYFGQFDDFESFAYDYVESTGMLHNVPEEVKRYFDYSSFARDLSFDFCESDGHIFSNF
jgi:antirestriction protein